MKLHCSLKKCQYKIGLSVIRTSCICLVAPPCLGSSARCQVMDILHCTGSEQGPLLLPGETQCSHTGVKWCCTTGHLFSSQDPAGSDSCQQLPSCGLSPEQRSLSHNETTSVGQRRREQQPPSSSPSLPGLLGADASLLQRALAGHLYWKRGSLSKVRAALSNGRAGAWGN